MKILIVGAGIAGAAMYHRLKDGHHNIDIIEKSNEDASQGGGICLPAHAIAGFEKLGFKEKILARAHHVNEIRFETSSRQLLSKASLLAPPLNVQPFVAMERGDLLDILLSEIKHHITYEQSITHIVSTENSNKVTFSDGKTTTYDLVIGADGINSQVRHCVFDSPELLDLNVTNWRFCIDSPNHNMQPSYLLGNNDLFMFYPISNNRLYCYAQISDVDKAHYKVDAKEIIGKLFSEYCPQVSHAIAQADHVIKGQLKSVVSREVYHNHVVLIGDALHGCPPSLQQGVSMAIEDVLTLGEAIEKTDSIHHILHQFKTQRLEHINWVMEQSNKAIKLAEIGKTPLGRLVRNVILRITGPTNVSGWRKLMFFKTSK